MGDNRYCRMGRRATQGKRPRFWASRTRFWLSMFWKDHRLECWYTPRRGFRLVSLVTYSGLAVRWVTNFPQPEFKLKKKSVGGSAPNSPHTHLAPVESNVLHQCPQLIAHCAVVRYDDGDQRKPGWVTIKTLGSAWVVEAKDPDSCAVLRASADTLDNALAMIDLLLGSEEAPWEPDQWLRQQASKKR